jgi:arginase
MMKVALIPFACGAGASVAGGERGPSDLKAFDIAGHLARAGVAAEWLRDPDEILASPAYGARAHKALPPHGSSERREFVLWHCAQLRDAVEEAIRAGMLPVTLGGDHTMAAGSVAGLARARAAHGRIGLIWVDAHPDLNTWETTSSKAMHGMPVAALLGMADETFSGLGGGKAVLNPRHVHYIGIRDIDPGERAYIEQLGIRHVNVAQALVKGIEETFREAIEALRAEVDYLALSIDIDNFDPADAPAVGSPVPEGFHAGEMLPVLRAMAADYRFDLIEVTEYNPALPGKEKTRALVRDVLDALLKPAQ